MYVSVYTQDRYELNTWLHCHNIQKAWWIATYLLIIYILTYKEIVISVSDIHNIVENIFIHGFHQFTDGIAWLFEENFSFSSARSLSAGSALAVLRLVLIVSLLGTSAGCGNEDIDWPGHFKWMFGARFESIEMNSLPSLGAAWILSWTKCCEVVSFFSVRLHEATHYPSMYDPLGHTFVVIIIIL